MHRRLVIGGTTGTPGSEGGIRSRALYQDPRETSEMLDRGLIERMLGDRWIRPMHRYRLRSLMALIVLVAAAGCGTVETPCESAVREAAEIPVTEDSGSDFDNAIETCATVAELEAASEQFPDALDGVSVRTFVGERCRFEPAIADSAVCNELGE